MEQKGKPFLILVKNWYCLIDLTDIKYIKVLRR